jgi:nonsense-mediated mRNA decay protein 3
MICHKCGKKTKTMGLCAECFMRDHPVAIEDITLPMCGCGRYYYHIGWHQPIERGLGKMIREHIEASPEIKIKDVRLEPTYEERRIRLKITITGSCKGEDLCVELAKDIRIEPEICSVCKKISSNYYEAVLQFRVPVNAKKVLDGEYVTRTEKVAGGFDAYITSAQYAKKLGKDFSRKGFIVGQTAKLVGKKAGKDLYRIFIVIKSPGPQEGDFIRYKEKILEVLSFGKSIRTRNIEQRKTLMLAPLHIQDAPILATKEDVRRGMVSSIKPGGAQVMDLGSYETFEVPGLFGDLKEKDEVRYVKIAGKTYIL